MNYALLSILLVGVLAVPAHTQEKFTLKLKQEAKGDVTQSVEKETHIFKTATDCCSSTFKEEIIDKVPGKEATKLKRTYQKAEWSLESTDFKSRKVIPSFVGKEMLIDLSAAAQPFTVDGKALTGDDMSFMAVQERFKPKVDKDPIQFDELMLPMNQIGVGDTWKPDVAALIKRLLREPTDWFTVDIASSTAAGKLLKAYKKDGKQFGVFEIELKFALIIKRASEAKMFNIDATSLRKMTIHFDGCIDRTSRSGTMETNVDDTITGWLRGPDGVEGKLNEHIKQTRSKTVEDLTGKK